MTPFLLDSELEAMTMPLRQPGARRRYLDRLGVPYLVRPNGQPLVSRLALQQLLGGGATTSANDPAPDFASVRRPARPLPGSVPDFAHQAQRKQNG